MHPNDLTCDQCENVDPNLERYSTNYEPLMLCPGCAKDLARLEYNREPELDDER